MDALQTKLLDAAQAELKFALAPSGVVSFGGYASVFNVVDQVDDIVLPGSFVDVLATGAVPHMFFNHRALDVPIGLWVTLNEDAKGLRVEGELTPGNYLSDAVYAGYKHGTIKGLSIGYRVAPGGSRTGVNGVREIKKFGELPEISVVTNPANEHAGIDVTAIKAALSDIASIEHLEDFLRDACGLSRQAAKAVISVARPVLSERESREQKRAAVTDQVASQIERLARFEFPELKGAHHG